MSTEPTNRLAADLLDHQGFLRRVARDLVGEDAADDLVQDAWVAVLERPPGPTERPRSLRAWLRALLRNKSVDRVVRDRRRAAREEHAAREERLASVDEVEERLELVRRVADAVRALPEPYKRVVYLRTYEDRGPTDIARELDVPLETVHSRLKRGKALLGERLDREYGGDRRAWSAALVALAGRDAPLTPLSPEAPVSATPPGLGALVMGSKAAIAVVAGVALTATLLVWKPWSVDGEVVDAPIRAAVGDPVTPVDPLPARPVAPAVVENENGARREAVAVAEPAMLAVEGGLAVRVRFASDDAPAAGVHGHLERDDVPGEAFVLDREGAIELTDLRAGRWSLHLHGYGAWSWDADVVAGETTSIELALDPGISVRGRVLDPDERPVPGAEVFLARDGDVPGAWTVTATDRGGWFDARDIAPWRPEGPYTELAARAPGYTSSHSWEAVGVPGDRAELVLRLIGRAGSVRGRVLAHDGKPVAGVELQFPRHGDVATSSVSDEGVELEEAPALCLVTDGDGEFAADTVSPGTHAVRVVSTAHPEKTVAVDVQAGATEYVEIVLAPGGALEGTVRDPDGNGLSGVGVKALGTDDGRGRRTRPLRHRWAETDAEGTYRFEGLPGGTAHLDAYGGERGDWSGTVAIVVGETTRHDVVLVPGAKVEGVLVDEGGAPLAEHWVCVIEPSRPGLWLLHDRTDDAGRFRLQGYPEGPKAFEIRRPEPFSTAPILTAPWPDEEGGEVRLVVPAANLPTAAIEGLVLDSAGAPVEGVELWLNSQGMNWGDQGFPDRESQRFRFGPLVPGDYRLSVDAPGHVSLEIEVLDVALGEARDLGIVRLATGGVLHVDLSSTDPLVETVDPYAWLISEDGGESRSLDAADNAVRSPVLPAGSYELRLSGFASAYRAVPVTIVPGETTRLEVELEPGTSRVFRLDPEPGTQPPKVEVFDPAGRPYHGNLFTWGSQVSIHGLTIGEWRVVVRTDDGLVGETTFTVDTLDYPTELFPLELR